MVVEPLPDNIYAQLAEDPDLDVRTHVAGVRFLPGSVRRRLVADGMPVVRVQAFRRWPRPVPDDVVELLMADPDLDVARVARLAHPRTAPAELVAGLTDEFAVDHLAGFMRMYDLTEAAAVIGLTPAVAAVVVGDRRVEIRVAVAENATLPADLVARLAVDPVPSVRRAVSMRPELTEEQRAAIDYEVRGEDRLIPPRWVYSSLDDLDLMSRCARSAHIGLRRFAALSPHLTPDLVAMLARDTDFAVRLLLCENHPATPADLLLRTYLEARVITRSDLLARPNFPRSGLADGAASDDPERRYLALLDPATTPAQVEGLSHDVDDNVRSAAARDRRLSFDRVRELLADPATAASAASNPSVPIRLMHDMLDDAGVAACR
jgi:hypothetical protein